MSLTVIIEGPDGAGKSTLVDIVARELDMDIIRMTANGDSSYSSYVQKLACDNVVFDRCWISEQIYAEFFGRQQRIEDIHCKYLNEIAVERHIPIIFVLPSIDVIISRLQQRGDEFSDVVIPNIRKIYEKYEEYLKKHDNIQVITSNDFKSFAEAIARFYRKESRS